MSAPARALDVSRLPTTVFDHRSHMWWGTLGFMVIEGTTLFVCIASYFYLRLNFTSWPPEHTLRPDLFWPTVHVVVLLASIAPIMLADRAARRLDLPGLRRWFVVASLFAISFLFLRWQDFLALNVRWDANAYGSIAWVAAGFHGTILLLQVIETLVKAGVGVYEATRWKTGLEELFARLTEAEEAERGMSAVDTLDGGPR